jgi:hypothetical protein
MPFLDNGFRWRRLLAGVAAVRHVEAEQAGKATGRDPQGWLWPAAIYALRNSPPMPAEPLTPTQRVAVTVQLDAVASAIPAWLPLLRLPIRYALLEPANGAISASSRAWQQHVLLADVAFTSDRELREQLVHELAHQWLYLIQELCALEAPGAEHVILPSGTANRSPAEVLGAAHVAATLTSLYTATADQPPARLSELTRYGRGCLDHAAGLTSAGHHIAHRLREALWLSPPTTHRHTPR